MTREPKHPAAPAISSGRLPTLSSNITAGRVDTVSENVSRGLIRDGTILTLTIP